MCAISNELHRGKEKKEPQKSASEHLTQTTCDRWTRSGQPGLSTASDPDLTEEQDT
jgi:hypothetical protein